MGAGPRVGTLDQGSPVGGWSGAVMVKPGQEALWRCADGAPGQGRCMVCCAWPIPYTRIAKDEYDFTDGRQSCACNRFLMTHLRKSSGTVPTAGGVCNALNMARSAASTRR